MRRVAQASVGVALAMCAAIMLPGISALGADCDSGGWAGNCNVSNSGTQVDIDASSTTSVDGGQRDAAPPARSGAAAPAPPEPVCDLDRCDFSYGVDRPPDLTLADLASFRPAAPGLGGEPSGFGVVGMPTNLVATASEQRIAGTVLGWDVTVRFVPAGYVFDYGDGSAGRSTSGGTSWQRLGQAQFTPTATSHVYSERGTYPVSVRVEYAASVDFGSGTWRPVAGYVTSTASGYGVRVVEVRTALVDQTCAEDPRGPGC